MGNGWHIGISDPVCLAAMIPPTWATASTSPFSIPPRSTSCRVPGRITIRPRAVAARVVSSLADTSTMCARPDSSRWERVNLLASFRCTHQGFDFRGHRADVQVFVAHELRQLLDRIALAISPKLDEELARLRI